MKKLIFFILLFNCVLVAQEKQIIQDIRTEYAAIKNAMATFTRDSTAAPDSILPDGDAFYYRDQQKNIRLIELRLLEVTGRTLHEYYFKNNRLFFVYTEVQEYNAPNYMTD
ncbi:hypothetical protein JW964_21395, partial [candidate division KSB1 bacterium]|nr:hypothetical protein [candidate division KSB1 bacterium]